MWLETTNVFEDNDEYTMMIMELCNMRRKDDIKLTKKTE